jgi:16S rRNA (uracil1498-N3)-methyltransferase
MSRRRFIADAVKGDRAILAGAHAAHLSRVLRARPGQEFDIAANGCVRRGRILTVAADRVEFQLGEEVPATTPIPVTLYLAVIKFERLEWAIEKCTELGVAHIVPLIAGRTDTHLAAAAAKRVERWRRLATQAAEQSRRTAPPEIGPPVKLSRDVLAFPGSGIVLAESEARMTLKEALAGFSANRLPEDFGLSPDSAKRDDADAGLALAIGPEGGWTELELNWFGDAGWTSAALGPTILRTETAAIAALALVMAELPSPKIKGTLYASPT